MNILVIGGTGHIGSYLVPRLTRQGHAVTVVARHSRPQYGLPELGWKKVNWITADRLAEERSGAWFDRMRAVEADVVMDLLCYTSEQNDLMVRAFRGRVSHFIHCGTIWAYGPAERVPGPAGDPISPAGWAAARGRRPR